MTLSPEGTAVDKSHIAFWLLETGLFCEVFFHGLGICTEIFLD